MSQGSPGQTERAESIVAIVAGAPSAPDPSIPIPDVVIAVDSGLTHVRSWQWRPDLVVGDLDSARPADVRWAEGVGAAVDRHPVDKDETDLELALGRAALDHTGSQIHVLAVDGGRPDHTLGNLLLLAAPAWRALALTIHLTDGTAWPVHDRWSRSLTDDALLSIVPVGGDAVVSATGVRWPLDRSRLLAHRSRGVSNRVHGSPVITVHDGVVLVLTPHHPPEEPE